MGDKKASILEKVRLLLAKAASTTFEAEADECRRKADQLMANYAIEQWELAKPDSETRVPVKRDVDISWFYDNEMLRSHMWGLFYKCAEHARCIPVAAKSVHLRRPDNAKSGLQIPVIGLPSDLDYMDLLFTSLFMYFVKKVDPSGDPNLSYHENLRVMKEAGLSWPETAARMQKIGYHTDVSTERASHLTVRAYRKWCKETGVPQDYSNWKTFRRSFADGFVYSIGERFEDMRKVSQGEGTGNSMSIALRDIRTLVRDAMYDMYPDLRPGPAGGIRRPVGRKVAVRRDNRKVDHVAQAQGLRAGREAEILTTSSKLRRTPELGG